MIPKSIVDTVLRKFMTAPRQPKYLDKPEYKHLQERNKELYLSSAWLKSDWSWDKVCAFFEAMTSGKSYFLCSLPYQLAIKEGLLMREQVEDEMSEADFSTIGLIKITAQLKICEPYYSRVYNLRLGVIGNDN